MHIYMCTLNYIYIYIYILGGKMGRGGKSEMGRRKVKIQRLESTKERQAKYSKRKAGIVKKAKELSILCDVDVALLLFSPTEKPTLFVGHDKDLSSVVDRLSKYPSKDREERRAYTMKMLKKIHAKSDVEPEVDPGNTSQNLESLEDQVKELKEKIAEKSRILRDWKNPNNVEELSQIKIMEDHIIASLDRIRNNKSQLANEQQKRQEGLEGSTRDQDSSG